MSKYVRVDFQKQPWGYAKVGGIEMSASLSVHEVGSLGVAIDDVVAVSHVWGNPQYEVENVQSASHRIKFSSPEKMRRLLGIARSEGWEDLWLDNICINQEDEDEKSREVLKMGYVYRETKATVVLLDSTRSELLRETVPKTLQFQGQTDVTLLDEVVSDVNFGPLIDMYVELGRDKWYERLWTVQESTLASRLYMAPVDEDVVYDVSGLKDCKHFWDRLLRFVQYYYFLDSEDRYRFRLIRNFAYRFLVHSDLRMGEALMATTDVKCSVEKDRLYGILGLIPNVNITPAYDHTSLEEVAVMVMKQSVNNLKQMDLLHRDGPKLEEMGKHMVPTWNSLKNPRQLNVGIFVHDDSCKYDENVGLVVSNPRVFQAKIIAVIEPDQPSMESNSPIRRLFRALKEKLDDDQMIDLIRGIMCNWEYPHYGVEVTAGEYLKILAHVASLPPHTDTYDVLERVYGLNQLQQADFDTVWNSVLGHGAERIYILGITKDNNCHDSCCKRTFISVIRSSALLEAKDNLVVVDYGRHITNQVEGGRDDRVPLIVGERVQEEVKFISTIVLEGGIRHEAMAFQRDAVTIV